MSVFYQSKILRNSPEEMSEGGEVEPRKMFVGGEPGIGFRPPINFNLGGVNNELAQFDIGSINDKISQEIQASIAESMQDMPNYAQILADIESRLDEGITEQDVASQISEAVAGLPEGITLSDVQQIVDANPGLTKADVLSVIEQNPGIQLSDVQSQIDQAIAGLPEGLTEADIQRVVDANPGLTREDVLSIVEANPGISFQDVETAINTALENAQAGISSSIQELRTLAERLYEEEGDFQRDPYEGDVDAQREIDREQFIENFIERNRDRLVGETPDFQQLIQNQINSQIQDGTIASGDTVTTQTIAEMISAGTLTPEEIQKRIDAGDITKEDVLSIIQGGFELSEEQLAQLFESGVLTREEIAALVEEAIADIEDPDEGLTEDDVERIAGATGLSEEDVLRIIGEAGFAPEGDYATEAGMEHYNRIIQDQFKGITDQLSGFATQEQLSGLESMFQNYLTPEQLQGYLPAEGTYVTPEQLAEATANDYDDIIKGLTDKLGELETKYQNVTDQYEADAVNAQIDKTKDDLNTFFRGAVPTGPRTGSTSQFTSGASFLPGGSPMANLIAGQRQGLGQDPFSTYLKTFTPSYSAYDAPVTAEEYGLASLPLIDTQYSNPFTGGASYRSFSPTSVTTAGADGRQYGLTVMPDDDPGSYNQGGQVSNGIMDLTNFQTNVQPFQNAFRPNVPRN